MINLNFSKYIYIYVEKKKTKKWEKKKEEIYHNKFVKYFIRSWKNSTNQIHMWQMKLTVAKISDILQK